jgi:hypothetical protein
MGIAGAKARRDQGHALGFLLSSGPKTGIHSGLRFRFEKSTLFPKDLRVDGSERGGPRLPGSRGPKTAGEPSRPNRRQMRRLPRLNPILPSGTPAAGAGSKSSLRASHEDQRRALEWVDLCPPTYEESPKRWTERAKASGNSHCTPTPLEVTLKRKTTNSRAIRDACSGQTNDDKATGLCAPTARRNAHCAPTGLYAPGERRDSHCALDERASSSPLTVELRAV